MGGVLLDFTAAFDIIVNKSLLTYRPVTIIMDRELFIFKETTNLFQRLWCASGSLPQAVDIYTVFTNGLLLVLNKVKMPLYADHSTINRKCQHTHSFESNTILGLELQSLIEWVKKNKFVQVVFSL